MISTGQHALIDIYGVPQDVANNVNFWLRLCQEAAIRAQTTILAITKKEFKPYGCSGILLISESHISFHTFPECNFVAIDFYTCGKEDKFELALRWMINKIKSISPNVEVVVHKHKRGEKLDKRSLRG